jgi:hypothetical protein
MNRCTREKERNDSSRRKREKMFLAFDIFCTCQLRGISATGYYVIVIRHYTDKHSNNSTDGNSRLDTSNCVNKNPSMRRKLLATIGVKRLSGICLLYINRRLSVTHDYKKKIYVYKKKKRK